MIIDADVHLSPLTEYETNMNLEKLLAAMEESGVDKALCWAHRPYVRDRLSEVQKYLYESMKRFPDRILGFGWIDPRLGMQAARDELHRCLYEYGFYGIKFNGSQNEHLNDDPDLAAGGGDCPLRFGPGAAHRSRRLREYASAAGQESCKAVSGTPDPHGAYGRCFFL